MWSTLTDAQFWLSIHPIWLALLATLFTWGLTAVGAAAVFGLAKPSRRVLDGMLGFAAGVMLAASYWSLLAPAIRMAEEQGTWPWLPPLVGFWLGGLFILGVDRVMDRLPIPQPKELSGNRTEAWRRSLMLILAITLHNVPEGLAVGVAFGALGAEPTTATLVGAATLALGIGIQNLPEGTAVAVPLVREGLPRRKAFLYGQLSGVVEPMAGLVGAAAVLLMQPLLPYALSFAAGAMVLVVIKELIPASQSHQPNQLVATLGAMGGFGVMMLLDVALG